MRATYWPCVVQNKKAELNAVKEHGAKMVNLASKDAKSKWGQLEVFMSRWRDIEKLVDQDGPFIWQASRTTMSSIDLG